VLQALTNDDSNML